MAQLITKHSLAALPDGYLHGLREVAAYVRCHQNWAKLLPHMMSLAGEENAPFQSSAIHAELRDKIGWAAAVK